MFKMKFVAANKAIGWVILAVLISLATISMLTNLDAAWLRFLVVMTLTKVLWHCLERAKWIWGIYVSKKPNNMYVNSLRSQINKLDHDIKLHFELYAPKKEEDENNSSKFEDVLYEVNIKALEDYFEANPIKIVQPSHKHKSKPKQKKETKEE